MICKPIYFLRKNCNIIFDIYISPFINSLLREFKETILTNKLNINSKNLSNIIPKIIHLTWKTKDVSHLYDITYASITRNHSEWEIIVWTDEEMDIYVKENGTNYYSFYENLKFPIQKCDFFRVFIVYDMGGIYLDLDVIITKSFNSLIQRTKIFFPCEKIMSSQQLIEHGDRDEIRIGNYAFGSIPKHPFLLSFLHKIMNLASNESEFEDKNKYVLNSTGPGLLTTFYHEYIKYNPFEDILILYPSVFTKSDCICGSYKFVAACRIGHFGFHHHIGSWRV